MKFNIGGEYYVSDKYSFYLFKIIITHYIPEGYDAMLGQNRPTYYGDEQGGYWEEDEIVNTLQEAKDLAISRLQEFYVKKTQEIMNGIIESEDTDD